MYCLVCFNASDKKKSVFLKPIALLHHHHHSHRWMDRQNDYWGRMGGRGGCIYWNYLFFLKLNVLTERAILSMSAQLRRKPYDLHCGYSQCYTGSNTGALQVTKLP